MVFFRELGQRTLQPFTYIVSCCTFNSCAVEFIVGDNPVPVSFHTITELDQILAEDADLKRINLNALISSILMKYAEWDRYAERFSHISVPITLSRGLLDLITDEDALAKLADRLGVELSSETASFWFKKINQETLLRFQRLACKYGGAGEIEIKDERQISHSDLTFSVPHTSHTIQTVDDMLGGQYLSRNVRRGLPFLLVILQWVNLKAQD